jgi:WD40 repeat protein
MPEKILLDAETGRELRSLTGHGDYEDMAFSPDGRRITTGSWDGMLKIWDVETGRETATYSVKDFPITAVGYSPNGRNIACVVAGINIHILDAGTGKKLRNCVRFAQHR